MERTNARSITAGTLPEPVSLSVIDVSFISLRLILGPVASAFVPDRGGDIVALVKPQFEAGRTQVKGGVVRDPAVHRSTIEGVVAAAEAAGLEPIDVIPSPILGPEGNREFLVHFRVGAEVVAPAASLAGRIEAATGAGATR